MSIIDKYKINSIDNSDSYEWLLRKHYAKTIPSLIHSFGLFNIDNEMMGVCCYGSPANNHNNNMGKYRMIELVRLCIKECPEKNLLSYFVAGTFHYLKKPLALISYADQGKNHHGYIYQATNWIYTGLGGGVDFYIDENKREIHSRIMSDYRLKYPNMNRDDIAKMLKWDKVEGTYKHRYFMFLGSKRDKKDMRNIMKEKYSIKEYPKGDNIRYDASYEPNQQLRLFAV